MKLSAPVRIPLRRLLLSVVALAALLVFAFPAAAVPKVPIGPRIDVFLGTPTTFPANQPFHVRHSWFSMLPPTDEPGLNHFQAIGKYGFRLELDGETVEPDYIHRFVSDVDVLTQTWVHNFPNGLSAGTHTFRGFFTGPCQRLVDVGYIPGPCAQQNEIMLAGGAPVTLTVEFTP